MSNPNWPRIKLKYLVALKSGDAIDGNDIKDEGDYPVYGGNGLRGHTSGYTHEGERILIGRQGALCGNINYATGKFWATEHAIVATPKQEFNITWLGEALRAMNLNQYAQSAAQPGIAVEVIENLDLAVPPRAEQEVIAQSLTARLVRIDQLVVAKQSLLDALAEKRRALIAHAVMRGLNPEVPMRESGIEWLGAIPAHWQLVALKRTLTSMTYGTSQSVNTEGPVGIVRMGDIRDGNVDLGRLGFLDDVESDLDLAVGDLLFNRTNSLDQIGKVALVRELPDFRLSFASYLVRLRCAESVNAEYLNFLLNSVYANAFARSEALPSIGQANLNPDRFSYLPIPLPPRNEQEIIARVLREEVELILNLQKKTRETLELLAERRQSLILSTLTGEDAVS